MGQERQSLTIPDQVTRYGQEPHKSKPCPFKFTPFSRRWVYGKPIATLRGEGEFFVLRITLRNESECKRFVVEGKLAGECVGELEKCWNALGSDHSPESILVDLSCVSFIDADGKHLLAQMHEKGIRIVANRLMPKCIIEEIEGTPLVECQPQKSDVISS